jgi:MoaA/NifB/PqqE/SkfB family radical SAM enzyme
MNAALSRAAGFAVPVLQLGVRRALRRKSPFQMTLSLTNRCNFRCTYCEIPLQQRDEMDTSEWCAVIDELHAGGMGRASIIGGEPLLRKDAGAIIRHLKRRGVHASMNTNGWLIAERIERAHGSRPGVRHARRAGGGARRQRHAGSYARVLRGIEALRARGVPVVTMTVVTPDGHRHVEHVLDVARQHGIRAYFPARARQADGRAAADLAAS